jgi:hypothetical protein
MLRSLGALVAVATFRFRICCAPRPVRGSLWFGGVYGAAACSIGAAVAFADAVALGLLLPSSCSGLLGAVWVVEGLLERTMA